MFAIATLPKPFAGHIGIIQRNAIASWLRLTPRPQVMLFGNEEGVRETAREFSVEHIPEVQCNIHGTPLLSSVFPLAESHSREEYLCFTNADILLLPELTDAFQCVSAAFQTFLLVGECVNLNVRESLAFDPASELQFRSLIHREGKRRGRNADYFIYRRGMFPVYPPLTLGRAFYDNWILYEARRLHIPVVDVTQAHRAVHQNHFYSAVPGETGTFHKGVEAEENFQILGKRERVYWITDSTHVLSGTSLRRNIAGSLLIRIRWEMTKRNIRRFLAQFRKRISQ